jgi:pimeloyl-ACP methyl ester carboxylesterase
MRTSNILAAVVFSLLALWLPVPAQTPPKAKWAKYNGARVRYYDIGDKKATDALVFVHCWTCNAEFWREQYNAFPNYRVIAMDLPGHGQSDKPKVDYTMEHFARAVDAVMKKAGVKRAVLAGHSMGTPVVRRYYELFPEKSLGLIIVDGALLPFGPRDQVEKFFEPLFKDYKGGAATFIDGMLETAHARVRPFIRAGMLATPDHVGSSAMKFMLDDAYAPHGRITVPVLALMAPNQMWPPDLEQKYRDIAPDLDFQTIPGVSHFLQLEMPAEFNAAMGQFITRKKLL